MLRTAVSETIWIQFSGDGASHRQSGNLLDSFSVFSHGMDARQLDTMPGMASENKLLLSILYTGGRQMTVTQICYGFLSVIIKLLSA